jgi:uncharacterized protein (DUF983 family)
MAAPSPVSEIVQAGLKGCCPRCGKGPMFAGTIRFAPCCSNCGLDFDSFNVGDGPAAFLTLGIGTLVTILAVIVELALEPAWWIHVLLWVPLTLGSVIWSLRIAKGALLAAEYRNAAREGRVVERS